MTVDQRNGSAILDEWSLALIGNASGQAVGAERRSRSEGFLIKASDDSPKTFSFYSRNAAFAPQRAHVRKTNWKYKYFTPISPQYC